jgi:hypothetical protein
MVMNRLCRFSCSIEVLERNRIQKLEELGLIQEENVDTTNSP